jgi:hypothetical protein
MVLRWQEWYYGAMIRETKAYDCTCEKCGYVWFSPSVPARCSSCKNRKWNEGEKAEKMIIEKPKEKLVRDPEPEKPRAIPQATTELKPATAKTFISCPECGSIGGMHQRLCKRQ